MGAAGGAGVLLITAESAPTQGVRQRLRAQFGLSRAEAAICTLLAEDLSVNDIADLRGVATDTVRAQLKTIFEKTGLNKQGQVINLVAALGRLGPP